VPLSEGPTTVQGVLLVEAFLLLSSGPANSQSDPCAGSGCGEAAVDETLAGLERISRRVDPRPVRCWEAWGLSIEPSRTSCRKLASTRQRSQPATCGSLLVPDHVEA
jgi:hypothetical protein